MSSNFNGNLDVSGYVATDKVFAGQIEIISGSSGAIINPNIQTTIVKVPQEGGSGSLAAGTISGQIKIITTAYDSTVPGINFVINTLMSVNSLPVSLSRTGAPGVTFVWGGKNFPYWSISGI